MQSRAGVWTFRLMLALAILFAVGGVVLFFLQAFLYVLALLLAGVFGLGALAVLWLVGWSVRRAARPGGTSRERPAR